MRPIDHLVLTAANPAQAAGYEEQLRLRAAEQRLGPVADWRVMPDPQGRRIGSGGATLMVLAELAADLARAEPRAQTLDQLLAGRRIVIIHSGGDSRRLPAYAAEGKVFAPLPCAVPAALRAPGDAAEAPAALFDLILESLLALPCPPQGQVLVASGDVLASFDPARADFNHAGVVGVAFPADLARGARHGVYVLPPGAAPVGAAPVTGFLQKPSAAQARAAGAVDAVERVLVDSGLVSLGPDAAGRLLGLAGASLARGRLRRGGWLASWAAGRGQALDLYQEIMMALPAKARRGAYLAANGDHAVTRALFDGLRGLPFRVSVAPVCEFFHVGSSREFIAGVSTLSQTAERYGFRAGDHAAAAGGVDAGACVFNAILASERTRLGAGAVVEGVACDGPLVLPGPNLVTGLAIGRRGLRLPAGLGLTAVPIAGAGKRETCLVFGLDDSFKDGSAFLNQPLEATLARLDLKPADLWAKGEKPTLWNARLWAVGARAEVQALALGLAGAGRFDLARFRRLPRLSLAEVVRRTDHARLIAHRQEVQRRVRAASVALRAEANPLMPCEALLADLQSARERGSARADLLARAEARGLPPLMRARLLALADTLAGASRGRPADGLMDRALLAVAQSVASEVKLPEPAVLAVREDQAVWATAPARVDLAGGWSDTPPICAEMGGTVVNAAVTLCDQYPIQCVVKRRSEPVIAISSIDLGARSVVGSSAELLAAPDPHRWDALAKVAVRLAGLAPRSPRVPLERHLASIGGGFELTLFSALPKGSGLGTSSILAATMMAALDRAAGRVLPPAELCARTLLLEQMLTTGGGWQDQVGGVVPGVKIARTRPGADQRPQVHALPLPPACAAMFRERGVLLFTGVQRMAKGILHGVVGRFLRREGGMLRTVAELKEGAERLALALAADDVAGTVAAIGAYGAHKRGIDPGSTNARVEAVLGPLAREIEARSLCGAGGGGFALLVARSPEAAQRIRAKLASRPPNPLCREFPFQVDTQGLKVTVL